MNRLFLALLLLFGCHTGQSQTITGKWYRIVSTIEDDRGEITDLQQTARETMPCLDKVVYIFHADGTMTSEAKACSAPIQQSFEKANKVSRWKKQGNALVVSTTNNSVPPSTYHLSFSGDTMTWTFIYSENDKSLNPSSAKKAIITYKRLKS